MKILYYTWTEIMKDDCVLSLEDMGHTVKVVDYKFSDYFKDANFVNSFEKELFKDNYDCIISIDFIPLISKKMTNILRRTPFSPPRIGPMWTKW